MPDPKQIILDRDLNPYHSFFASFFAGLGEMGMLNQGSINIVARRASEYLYAYLDAKEILPVMDAVPGDTRPAKIKNLVLYVNKILSLVGEYDLRRVDDNSVVLLITGSTCRICPKGVGGAEVKGTLCPIPALLENLINQIAKDDLVTLITEGIEKEGTICKAYYQIAN